MQDELQAKGAEFEKEMATLPENIKQRRQQELQDMYTRMQQFAQESQSNVQKLSNDKMQAIQEKVTKVIAEIGKAGGYIYIMDITAGIPYISETQSTDLTSQVKSKLGATGAKTTPAKK
jgi:outer membrane protein